MIYVCKEFALNQNSSVAKLLAYFDKTNQSIRILPKGPEQPFMAGTAQTHVHQVSGTVANVAVGKSFSPTMELVECPSGTLHGFAWSRSLTLQTKKRLSESGVTFQILVRVGDLGLRSSRETVQIGVILNAAIQQSNSTRIRPGFGKCYVLTRMGWLTINQYGLLDSQNAPDFVFITNQLGELELLEFCL